MKKFLLDLGEYKIVLQKPKRDADGKIVKGENKLPVLEDAEEVYPLRDNLSDWLRLAGIWKDGIEVCDAHDLAKQVKNCTDDSLEVNEDELNLLKKVMNKLITQEPDPMRGVMSLGGEVHEEAIRRVFRMKETGTD